MGMGVEPLHDHTGKLPDVWKCLTFSHSQLFSGTIGQQPGHGSFHHMLTLDNAAIVSSWLLMFMYTHGVSVCVGVCLHREGIQWEAIDWMDNAECLDLIEKVTDSQTLTEQSHHQDRPLTTSQSGADPDATLCLH